MPPVSSPPEPFVHEAFFYHDEHDYLAGMLPFIHDGLGADEPILVAVPSDRLDLLRSELDAADRARVAFAPMEDLGRNPAWIIPAWNDFVAPLLADGRTARAIGEPVWSGRTGPELDECGRHESLLNLAFGETSGFTLMCPYDAAHLEPAVIETAHGNHPVVSRCGHRDSSEWYDPAVPAWLDTPLAPAPGTADTFEFDHRDLEAIRRRVETAAVAAGLTAARMHDVVVAVSEAASNSIRHGGGRGTLTTWRDGDTFQCEVADRGRIEDPLVGRIRPTVDQVSGRGIWIMNQLCDLVQIRATPEGQTVRLHVAI